MKEIKPVWRITIDEENITIFPEKVEPPMSVERGKYLAVVEDIDQLQVQNVFGKSYVLLLFKKGAVGCKIDEENKLVICGKDPNKVKIA